MKPIKNFLGIDTVEAIFDRLLPTVVSGKQVRPSLLAKNTTDSTNKETQVENKNNALPENITTSGSPLEPCNQENQKKQAIKTFVNNIFRNALDEVKSKEFSSTPLTEESLPHSHEHSKTSESLGNRSGETVVPIETKDKVKAFVAGVISKSAAIVRADRSFGQQSATPVVEKKVDVKSYVSNNVFTSADIVSTEKSLEQEGATPAIDKESVQQEIRGAVKSFVADIISRSYATVNNEKSTVFEQHAELPVKEEPTQEKIVFVKPFVADIISRSYNIVNNEMLLSQPSSFLEEEDIPLDKDSVVPPLRITAEHETMPQDISVANQDLEDPEVLKDDQLSLVLVNWEDIEISVDAEIKMGPLPEAIKDNDEQAAPIEAGAILQDLSNTTQEHVENLKDDQLSLVLVNWEDVQVSADAEIKMAPEVDGKDNDDQSASSKPGVILQDPSDTTKDEELDEDKQPSLVMVNWNDVVVSADAEVKEGPVVDIEDHDQQAAPSEEVESMELKEDDYVMVSWDQVKVSVDAQIKVVPEAKQQQDSLITVSAEQHSCRDLEIEENEELNQKSPCTLMETVMEEAVEEREDATLTLPVELTLETTEEISLTCVQLQEAKLSIDAEIKRENTVKQAKSENSSSGVKLTSVADKDLALSKSKCETSMKPEVFQECKVLENRMTEEIHRGHEGREGQEGQVPGVRHQHQFVPPREDSQATDAVAMGTSYALTCSPLDASPMATASTASKASQPNGIGNCTGEVATGRTDPGDATDDAVDICTEIQDSRNSCPRSERLKSRDDDMAEDSAKEITKQEISKENEMNGQEMPACEEQTNRQVHDPQDNEISSAIRPDERRLIQAAVNRVREEESPNNGNNAENGKGDGLNIKPENYRPSENTKTSYEKCMTKNNHVCDKEPTTGETNIARPSDGERSETAEISQKMEETSTSHGVRGKGDAIGGPANGNIPQVRTLKSRKEDTRGDDTEGDASIARPGNARCSKAHNSKKSKKKKSREDDREQGQASNVRPDAGSSSKNASQKYATKNNSRTPRKGNDKNTCQKHLDTNTVECSDKTSRRKPKRRSRRGNSNLKDGSHQQKTATDEHSVSSKEAHAATAFRSDKYSDTSQKSVTKEKKRKTNSTLQFDNSAGYAASNRDLTRPSHLAEVKTTADGSGRIENHADSTPPKTKQHSRRKNSKVLFSNSIGYGQCRKDTATSNWNVPSAAANTSYAANPTAQQHTSSWKSSGGNQAMTSSSTPSKSLSVEFPRWGGNLGGYVFKNTCAIDSWMVIFHYACVENPAVRQRIQREDARLLRELENLYCAFEFDRVKLRLMEVSKTRHFRGWVDFFGNEWDVYLKHLQIFFQNTQLSLCSSRHCPSRERMLESSTCITWANPKTSLSEEIQSWFQPEKEDTFCGQEFQTKPPQEALVVVSSQNRSSITMVCNGRRMKQGRSFQDGDMPVLLPVEVDVMGQLVDLRMSDIPRDVTVNKTRYQLYGATALSEKYSHYICIFRSRNKWYQYDGMVNGGKPTTFVQIPEQYRLSTCLYVRQ